MKADKLFNRYYIFYLMLTTVNYILFYMNYPIISKYTMNVGISLNLTGLITAAATVGALVARPFGGFCLDHLNKKMCIVGAAFLSGTSNIAFAFSESVALLTVTRAFCGVDFAFFMIAITKCAVGSMPENKTGEGIGFLGLGISAAAAIGPAMGLWFIDRFGYTMLFICIGVASFLMGISALFLKTETMPMPVQTGKLSVSSFIDKKTLKYAIFVIPFAFAVGFVSSYITLIAEARGIENISLFFTVYAVAMMALKPLSGKIMDKKGILVIMIPAFLCAAVGFGLVAVAMTLPAMLIAACFIAFGQGAGQPSLQTYCIKNAEPARTGVAISTYYLGLDVGNMLGNLVGTQLSTAIGYSGTFFFIAALLVTALVFFLCVKSADKKSNG